MISRLSLSNYYEPRLPFTEGRNFIWEKKKESDKILFQREIFRTIQINKHGI